MERFNCRKLFVIIFCTAILAGCKQDNKNSEIELFRVYEITLTADSPGDNPYLNGPVVTADFTGISGEASGKSIKISGFWDGGNTWKLRFAPAHIGEWTYKTTSDDHGLNKKRGSLTAVQQSEEHFKSNILYHGFLGKNDSFSWKLSDGTPFLPVGETQWSFSEEFFLPEWKEWINVLRDRNYNSFMGCVWLGKYTRTDLFPFENRDPSTDRLLVEFFQKQLDPMVQYANDKGIMMGLVIGGFPDNSQWFQKFKTIESNDRWFRYIIARYSAFNVRWGLFGELNEAQGRFALEDKTWQWVGEHYAKLIKENDPYRHPAGSHNTRVDTSAAGDPDIDFIEVQEGDRTSPDQYLNAYKLRKWNKPVWYEEYWYEMDGDQDVGIQNTHRNFIHAMAFPTMGSLMRNHSGINTPFPPDEAKKQNISLYDYLILSDTGILRMSYFADFYKVLIDDLDEFAPLPGIVDRGECGKYGDNFAVFLDEGGSFSIDLSDMTSVYKVICLDIKSGEVRNLENISGGKKYFIDSEIQDDAAILIISANPQQTN